MIISIVNQKGGVGKTITALNLGAALAEIGKRVLLVDLDTTQQSLTRQTTHLPSCETIASTAKSLADDLKARQHAHGAPDYILIDCPPTLGEETAAALRACDMVLVPLQPELPALEGLASLQKTLARARTSNPHLIVRLLITMSDARDPNCAAIEAQVRRRFGGQVLTPTVKRSPVFGRAVLERTGVLQASPKSHGATAYRQAARELMNHRSKRNCRVKGEINDAKGR